MLTEESFYFYILLSYYVCHRLLIVYEVSRCYFNLITLGFVNFGCMNMHERVRVCIWCTCAYLAYVQIETYSTVNNRL